MGKRVSDDSFQVRRLEAQHRTLGAKVAELDARSYLTTREQVELIELKKKKLAAKDALAGLIALDVPGGSRRLA